jgi:TrmH family RNA methyltransferase
MPKEFLLSNKSDKLKFFNSLMRDKKARQNHEQILVFGKKTVQELDHVLAYITTTENQNDPFFSRHDRYVLTPQDFKKLSNLVTPDGYGALVQLKAPHWPSKIKTGVLVLDRLSDPGNAGTLFRTAYGLGLDGIIFVGPSVDPYNPKVLSASKGTCLKLPWKSLENNEVVSFLNPLNLSIYSADLEGENLAHIKNKSPFALILGNESQGLSQDLKSLGTLLHIPQHHLESYNVAIAAAIISYTLLPKEDL